ncbi:hypothetical protein JOD24_000739 [Kroppenstedtia sanguinis]
MLKVDECELIILTQVLIMPSVIAMAWAVRLIPHLPRILFARFLLYYRRCSGSFSPDRWRNAGEHGLRSGQRSGCLLPFNDDIVMSC